MRLSIRWRLTLWNTLAVAVVLVAFGALQYGLLSRSLYGGLDRSLREQLDTLEARREGLAHWVEDLWELKKTYCIVYGPGGTVRVKTDGLSAESVPPAPTAAAGEVRFRDAELPRVGRQRLLEGRVELGGTAHAVVLMTSLEEADRELGRLRGVLLTAGRLP